MRNGQYNDEGLCAKSGCMHICNLYTNNVQYADNIKYVFTNNVHEITNFVNKQTNPKAGFTKSVDQTSAPRTNKKTPCAFIFGEQVCTRSVNSIFLGEKKLMFKFLREKRRNVWLVEGGLYGDEATSASCEIAAPLRRAAKNRRAPHT